MKKLIAILLMCACAQVNAGLKESLEYRFEGDVFYAGYCQAVLEDNVKLMESKIRSHVGKVASTPKAVTKAILAHNGITCDGMDLVTFSKQRHATEIYAYLRAKND
ncbi:hypothetical protein [Aliiglaciecola sp. LCG003]|uniref:hypothetical protein n=1 Tax=Aliiglaciecola sp. LCG003 TaxID=3053655 RepID=UPI0025733914|nr:hypothetical protein [Aliiglaciecola sp. LCG003]WJG11112.1 hypothetical protein QR722_08820 [Aliiglaciecola sp. LCG003]